jgi:DNA-binding LacI/PurR family transcriptional regulator
LDRPDRPTAVLALWQEMTSALVAAARQLGLVPGREFEMVGWANEELYESAYLPLFAGGPVPPAVVWSIAEMAGVAVSALKQRRTEPGAPPRHLRVPAKLRAGRGAPTHEENNP